jgi:hypothetical protein
MDQHQAVEVPEGLEGIPAHMSAALHEMRLVTDAVSTTHTVNLSIIR